MNYYIEVAKCNKIVMLFVMGMLFPVGLFAQNWSIQATPTYGEAGAVNQWSHVTWAKNAPNGTGGQGLFVAVACTGGVMTSTDGVTWVVVSAPVNEWTSVAWSSTLNLFVAVAASGTGTPVMTSPDGVTWTLRATSVNGWWLDVIWCPDLSMFVAVGYPGLGYEVMTSTDGINWTGRVAGAPNDWNSVTWAASAPNGSGGVGLFVAVAQSGTGNRVMTSPDGINWTSRASASDNFWNDVTWSPTVSNGIGGYGLFVAVNADGAWNRIMTSPDGITWASYTTGIPSDDWYEIIWCDSLSNGSGGYGLFVVVGFSDGNGYEIMTSKDGATWTARRNSADNNYAHNYTALCWSHDLGILVALDYTTNVFMTSPNAISWTGHSDPACPTATDAAWQSITWGAEAPNGSGGTGLFVAVALPGNVNDQVMTSPDGVNWTARTAANNNQWTSVAWSPTLNLFVAVAESGTGNRAMTSPDGITWTSRVSAANNNWQSVAWAPGPGLFVAVSSNGAGNNVMTSADGITWTARTTPVPGINLNSVAFAPALNLFVAVGDTGTGNRVLTSPDGITWSSRTSAADNEWRCVAWGSTAPNGSGGQGLFVAVSQTGTGNRVMTSPDGITWASRVSAADYTWQSVAWAPELGLFVAVASSGTFYANPTISNFVMVSPDGITWTGEADALNNFWGSLAWSPKLGLFAAVAYSGANNISSSNIGDLAMASVPAAPVITVTNIVADSNSATISWTTNEEGSSQVLYGLTSGYGSSTATDSSLTFNHSKTITGLTCSTVYHFQVKSTLIGLSSSSADSTFRTSFGSCSPPAVNGAGNLCIGSGLTLSDSLPGGRWASSSPGVTVDSMLGTVTGIDSGVAIVTYAIAGHNLTTAVTVNPGIYASPGVSICIGSSTALAATGGASYSWSPSTGLSATTGSVVSANPVASTTYTVAGTTVLGCGSSDTLAVTVVPLPVISVGSGSTICAGSFALLTAGGATTYAWSPNTALSASTGAVVTATPTVTTTYTVTGTLGGCSNTATVQVSVNPTPSITGTAPVPVGSTATLNATPTGGTWTSVSTSIATIGPLSGIISGAAMGTSVISYTLSACSSSTTVTVNGVVTTWYSNVGGGDASILTNWWSNNNNTGFQPAAFTTSGNTWIYQSVMACTASSFTQNGNISIISGGSFTPASGSTWNIGGTYNNNGIFTSNGSTVIFNGIGSGIALTGLMTGNSKFNNLTFNSAGNSWTFAANSADVGGNFTITAGAVTAPSTTLQIAGNYINSGSFIHNGGTLVMNGISGTYTLSGAMTGANKFNNLSFNGAGGTWAFGTNSADIYGNYSLLAGTVTSNHATFNIGR